MAIRGVRRGTTGALRRPFLFGITLALQPIGTLTLLDLAAKILSAMQQGVVLKGLHCQYRDYDNLDMAVATGSIPVAPTIAEILINQCADGR
jgi:hypothetical protein